MEFFPIFSGVQWQAELAGRENFTVNGLFKKYNKHQRKQENTPKWTQRYFQPFPEEEIPPPPAGGGIRARGPAMLSLTSRLWISTNSPLFPTERGKEWIIFCDTPAQTVKDSRLTRPQMDSLYGQQQPALHGSPKARRSRGLFLTLSSKSS